MYLISVDPGVAKPSAYALIEDERVIDFGDLPPDALAVLGLFNHIALDLKEPPLIYFAIEDQYNDKSWRELKRLAAARGRIEGLAELAGFELLDPINPASWQTAVFRTRRPPRRGKMRDQLLIQYAEVSIAPGAGKQAGGLNIDHAAAIHIGLYAARRKSIAIAPPPKY